MATITFTIENGKIQRLKDAVAGLYEIPYINVGAEEEPDYQPEFTKSQWVKEYVRRHMIQIVAKYERQQSVDAIPYNEEDDLVS